MRDVLITDCAQGELDGAHDWWAEHRSAEQANRWYCGFLEELKSLTNDAERFPLAAESRLFPYDVRQLNYGLGNKPTHRALFTIRHEQVVILRVRHLAQKPLSAGDI